MKHRKAILCFIFILPALISSGQIGIYTYTPDASAELDIVYLTKGFLIPRLSLSSDLSNPGPVSSPANGLLIFNNGSNQQKGFYYWHSDQWNMIKTPTYNEISGPSGSTDNAAVRFNGNSGKIIQNSSVIIDDDENISGIDNLSTSGFTLNSSPEEGKILVSDASGNGSWQSAPPIDVEEELVTIVANTANLNFINTIDVKDEGNNKVTITFYRNSVTRDVIQLSSGDSLNINLLDTVAAIPWDVQEYKDMATYTHSTSTNPSRVQVNTTGIYEVNYMLSGINKTVTRKTIRCRLKKNGSNYFPHIVSYLFSYHTDDNIVSNVSCSFLIELNSGDYVELMTNGQTTEGLFNLIPNQNVFFMRLVRTL